MSQGWDDATLLRSLLSKMQADRDSWKKRAEQAETQLAGCSVAALGWNKEPANKGDYGWSASYQDVLDLREKFEALLAVGTDAPGGRE